MPRLIVSLDGVVVQDYVLTESRATLGRRSTNDIVLTDMAVSGEHVAFTYEKKIGIVVVEDLGSTNGTRVNGLKVRRQVLQSGDLLDIGKCRIRFLMNSLVPESHYMHASEAGSLTAKASHILYGEEDTPTVPADFPLVEEQPYTPSAYLRAVSGANEDILLSKVVTTVGRPGIAVAALTKRGKGYIATKVDGSADVVLNGQALNGVGLSMHKGDRIELAGMAYEFWG
ncbi:FHA domain-containing protein [Comamonas piscis]|uniref:FHA domain-containing protein n=1 Tax=Comamonas piscis TaxID=1562974 RepID=A0A7G5EDD5_9BURK|nr:FHA domain-containing protein [Comamonas piscis]QMV72010.1 FHA domain-containing protein [Comamonas piscis]WSO34755.1 FHA domain-containing protein [Comamonas piscis]